MNREENKDKALEAAVIGYLFGFSETINDEVLIKNIASLYDCTQKQVRACLVRLEEKKTLSRDNDGRLSLLKLTRKPMKLRY